VLVNGTVQSTVEVPLTRCGPSGCSFTATGLTNGTQYGLRLTVVNAVGESTVVGVTVTPHS